MILTYLAYILFILVSFRCVVLEFRVNEDCDLTVFRALYISILKCMAVHHNNTRSIFGKLHKLYIPMKANIYFQKIINTYFQSTFVRFSSSDIVSSLRVCNRNVTFPLDGANFSAFVFMTSFEG